MSLATKKAASVINLFTEMQKAYDCDLKDYEWLASKCNSQASLASVNRKSYKIFKMSVNSFKKYADLNIDGGFEAVDTLRVRINNEFKGVAFTDADNVQPLSKLDIAEAEIERLKRNQALIVKAYNELNRITLDLIAKDVKGNTLEYQKHQDLFSSYFGMSLVVNNDE